MFNKSEKEQIVQAIKTAEKNTSGEIRVHIEPHCKQFDPRKRAVEVFGRLNMHKTQLQNGVLFYMAYKDKTFAIIGDKGINDRVPPNFWEQIQLEMTEFFRQGRFVEGMEHGILQAGEQLKEYFPYMSDDVNELPDEISENEI